jgi:hypothetical protein
MGEGDGGILSGFYLLPFSGPAKHGLRLTFGIHFPHRYLLDVRKRNLRCPGFPTSWNRTRIREARTPLLDSLFLSCSGHIGLASKGRVGQKETAGIDVDVKPSDGSRGG